MIFHRLIRENRWTAFMLLSVALLYSFLLLAGSFSKGGGEPASKGGKEAVSAKAELELKEQQVQKRLAELPAVSGALSFALTALLLGGLWLDGRLIRRFRKDQPWVEHSLPSVAVRWGLRDVIQAFALLFFIEGCLFILQLFGYWITGLEMPQDLLILSNSLARDVGVTIFVLLLVRRRHGRPFSDLGLRTEAFFQMVRTGVLGYVAMIPLMAGVFLLLAMLMNAFSYEPAPQNVVQIYLKAGSEPYLLVFTLFVAVLGPVLEEIFFRGFAYPALRGRFGVPIAAAGTAAVFAAFHMSWVAFFPIFFLGLFLSYLYEATGSLVPSISAHVLHNSLMVLVTMGFRVLSQ